MTVIKSLNGFSGSTVLLIEENSRTFVRKIENVERNYERISHLISCGFNIPKIYNKEGNILDIEYIPSLDMKTYLENNSINTLISFLIETLTKLSSQKNLVNYENIYKEKLERIDFDELPFTKKDLIEKLPKELPQSDYFGDLTLENILYGSDKKFYLIDAVSIEYDSYIFDIAKLRQDLKCKWFLRNSKVSLDVKLNKIEKEILNKFPEANNDYLLILMLLRVYKHAKPNSFEQLFLKREINKLWK
jgi:RIO-like serine/threonine protein kinase